MSERPGVLLLLLLLGSSLLPLAAPQASAQPINVTGWNFLSATWGTASSPVEAGPGSQNVALVLTEQYFYANTATGVAATLNLPAGWSATTGGQSVSAYLSGSVASGAIETFTFYLNIASNVTVAEYSIPLTITWGAVTPNINSVALAQSTSIPISLMGKVSLAFSSTETSINPGITNTIPVTVTNTGTGPASSITVTVTAAGGASVTTPPYKLDSLAANSSTTFSAGIIIPSSLEGSSLTLTMSFTYTDAYGTAIGPDTQTLGIFVENPAALSPLSISVAPPTIAAGQTNVLSFLVNNTGVFPITDLAIQFSSASEQSTTNAAGAVVESGATQVTLLSPSLSQVQSLPSGSTTTPQVQLFVGDAVVGSISITLALSYYQGTIQKSESRTFGFIVTPDTSASFSPLQIAVTPSVLVQGAYTNMTIAITNSIKTPIVALSVTPTITASGVTILGPGIFQQQSLNDGSTMTIPMQVYTPPTAPSSGDLQLSLSYYVNNTLTEETRTIGILFKGSIDLAVTGTTITPTVLTPGSAGSITLTITNLGATEASAVTASAKLPAGFTAFGTTSTLLGDMETDTPTTFTVSMTVQNGTAGGTHQVPITFSYLDNLRDQINQTVDIPVTVAGGAGGFGEFGGGGNSTRTFTGSFARSDFSRSANQNVVTKYLPFPYLEIVIAVIAVAAGFFAGRRFSKPKAKVPKIEELKGKKG